LWVFLLEVCGLIFLPARDAAVPELVPEEQLPTANGLVMASSYGTIPVGAGVFALVAALLGHGGSRATYWAVFGIDAVTFLVSFAAIWRINRFQSARFEAEARSEPRTSFLQALRMPIVRSAAPAVLATCLGLGCLFSLGIVFVRKVLGASNAGFSGLIALFGVGAAVGLVTVRVLPGQRLRMIKWALIAQGATVAGMSLAPDLALTFVGAVAFGATTTIALANAVTELQECLDGPQRVMGFAVFHVAIRSGLAVAAVVAGFLADRLRTVSWPVLGHLPPARLVLLASGLVVVAGGFFFGAGRFRLEDSGTRAGGN
jgi:dTMP kinase